MSTDSPVVSLSRDGGVALITIDNPPVNALSSGVRTGLIAALDDAITDKSVRAIVLACAGRSFCAGADIREFDLPPQPPHLTDVIQRFADAGKPVVAALHGSALGGGCELAAGCHYRVAARGTRIGLPEVNLGLLPGAGGTQRLPRLVGRGRALEVILGCGDVDAETAERWGYVNRALPEGELRPFVDALAARIAAFPPEAVAHAKAAVEAAAPEPVPGLLDEAFRFNQTVALEATRARMDAFLQAGGQTLESELQPLFE